VIIKNFWEFFLRLIQYFSFHASGDNLISPASGDNLISPASGDNLISPASGGQAMLACTPSFFILKS